MQIIGLLIAIKPTKVIKLYVANPVLKKTGFFVLPRVKFENDSIEIKNS